MKIQPRTRQKKHSIYARSITDIRAAIERDAIRWNCSKSWIITTALGAFYGIDVVKPYEVKQGKVLSIREMMRKRA